MQYQYIAPAVRHVVRWRTEGEERAILCESRAEAEAEARKLRSIGWSGVTLHQES